MAERVWDKFLTEQDKAHLAASPHHRIGFGKRPALLLVDFYRGVFGDEPQPLLEAIETWPGSCGLTAWDSIPHIQAMLDATRDADIPVVHVTVVNDVTDGIDIWMATRTGSAQDLPKEEQEQRQRGWQIIDEVAPLPGEGVLRKTAASAFYGTPLAAHLNYLDVDTLIVLGESTSGCLRASVVDAAANRYRVIVVEECTFDRHEAPHAINLFDMDQKYADVLPLAEVVDWIAEWKSEKEKEAL
jgi:maleamate amidohydrolase